MARAEGILRLLLVDDSLTGADTVTNSLRSIGHAVRATRFDTLFEIEQALTHQIWDLLICRDTVTAAPPRELTGFIHRLGRDLPCIVLVSNTENIDELYSIGAQDIVPASDSKRLQFCVERELQNLYMRRLSRRNERALRESEKRSRLLLESSRDAVAYMHEGMHIYVNQAYLSLFGYEEAEDIDGLPFLDMVTVDDHAKFKSSFRQFTEESNAKPQTVIVYCVRADSSRFKANIEFSHAQVEGEECIQVVVRDEQEKLPSDHQFEFLRERDFLTGLYNRVRFVDELTKIAGKAGSGQGDAALLYLVIDDLRMIREQVGLAACDVVLKSLAGLLRRELVDTDILGRYSDWVFTIIVASDDDAYVDARAEAYRKAVDDYASHVNGKMIDIHCSIGISRISERNSSSEAVLELADRACTQAQHAGGNQVVRYQPTLSIQDDMANSVDSAEVWAERLNEALENNALYLNYQPIVSLHGEEQELYEVLLRWRDSDGSQITADKFIDQISKLDVMTDLDNWVIKASILCLSEHRLKHPKTRFFIKLSQQTLNNTEFVDWLCALLNEQNLDGGALVFEISETAVLNNLEHAAVTIAKLKNIGCEFGLEHFGSGLDFSQSLNALDVDYLKINGTFVENMAKDAENQAAVKAIIEMTKQAGKRSIAEFVSDANSLALLWRLGVDYAQGYYIHEPSDKLDYNFEDDDL
ncbi:MAG: EAL domain-containing protein [Gammaproteobacteria bacterium]|nr:EAL domain-containing protein [Gammaproteobacteria bacterium]